MGHAKPVRGATLYAPSGLTKANFKVDGLLRYKLGRIALQRPASRPRSTCLITLALCSLEKSTIISTTPTLDLSIGLNQTPQPSWCLTRSSIETLPIRSTTQPGLMQTVCVVKYVFSVLCGNPTQVHTATKRTRVYNGGK